MDDRIWPLIAFVAVTVVTNAYSASGRRWIAKWKAKGRPGPDIVVKAVIDTPIGILIYVIGAWADQNLWNAIVAPAFGWPKVDLIVALGAGWLAQSLFKGTTPIRVRVEEDD